jgi:hypothetical protein
MSMWKLGAYYALKPYLPRSLRMALRRLHALKTRATCASEWPIKESAGQAPEGWPGWPDGNRFAFVLTHDVETRKGLHRCQQLMELEQRLGFRSSFNFIPEGEYLPHREMRELLTRNGFEVGLHDLKHDGKLYRSRSTFKDCSKRMNQYLREWNAVGFRSGFMHHNLEWLHDLEIEYDSSTFDSDPFEPQPDDVNTIFPFWVDNHEDGSGYMELPYTLAQDSTLFLVLRQKCIDTWKRKLDWVAERGGMALVDVHPDYISFDGSPRSWGKYPSGYYSELLEYVREKHAGRFWHALPREVAAYCATFKPKRPWPPANRIHDLRNNGKRAHA